MSNALQFGKRAFTITVVAATIVWAMGLAALTPLSANAAAAGSLVKKASNSEVFYVGSDGKIYAFPNEASYKTWYADFSAVQTISESELAAMSYGGTVRYRGTQATGTAVKITSSPTVYAVNNSGVLRAIPDEATAASLLGATWNTKIHDIPTAFFGFYTIGTALPVGATTASLEVASADISSNRGLTAAPTTGTTTPTTPSTAALSAALSASSPASASAPFSSGNVVYGKVDLTGTGSVKKVIVTRTGLSVDADLSSVKLFDGTTQLGTNQTFDSAHRATFVLTTPWAVSGTKTLTIAADVAATGTATAGNVVTLGIASATDIELVSGSVSGTFPIRGNANTVVSTAIGTLTVTAGAGNPAADSTVDAGNPSPVVLLEARLSAGSVEKVHVTSVSALKGGTHVNSDINAIELYDTAAARVLATSTGWNADSRVQFDLSGSPIVIEKGESKNLQIRIPAGAVIAGTSRTLSARFEKSGGSFVGIASVGQTYNIGIVALDSQGAPGTGWAGTGTAQTINAGSLTFVRSTTTPATGNIAPGAQNVKIAAWDALVRGESVRATALTFSLTLTTMLRTEVTGCVLRDANGTSVAGPVDANATPAIPFTTTVTFPVGTNTYALHCNIATAVSAADAILAGITPSTQVTATGVTSGNTVTGAPAAAVNGNTQTVQAGSLAVNNQLSPAATNVVPGAQRFPLATLNLDTANSGEDVRVTVVTVTDTVAGAGSNINDWSNLRLEDATGNLVADVMQPSASVADATAGTVTFTLSTPIVITKKTSKVLKLFGDFDSGVGVAAETHTWAVALAANVAAAGVTTAATVTPTVNGTGQTMTVTGAGTVTTSRDASAPTTGIVAMGTTGKLVTALKLVGANETMKARSITLTLLNSNNAAGNPADLGKVYLYDGDTLLADGYFSTAAARAVTFDIENKNYTLGHLQTKALKVKADIASEPSAVAGRSVRVNLAATTDLVFVGQSSGQAINASAVVTGNPLSLRKTVPTFTKNVDNTTVAIPGTMTVLKLDITAGAGADVVFTAGAAAAWAAGDGRLRFAITQNGGTATVRTVTLRRASGQTVLDTFTYDLTTASGVLDFNFSSAALTVAAGTTETVEVRVDLTDYATQNESFSLSLQTDAAEVRAAGDNIRWSDDSSSQGTLAQTGIDTFTQGGHADFNGYGLSQYGLPIDHTVTK